MISWRYLLGVTFVIGYIVSATQAAPLAGFTIDGASGEQRRSLNSESGARALMLAPADFSTERQTHLLIFALPNGNTIEQTIGCRAAPGLDWHFDIQHIGAQVRLLRQVAPYQNVNLVVAYVEADGLSWPAWRQKQGSRAPQDVAAIVDQIRALLPGKNCLISLAAHSGGGAFLFSYIDAFDEIPSGVGRIAFLDANYSFDEAKGHAAKLTKWLRQAPNRHLNVIAYDDRDIMLNGKKVVSDTGGTWRASMRMIDAIGKEIPLQETQPKPTDRLPIVRYAAGDSVRFLLHQNPEKKILHTRLVELNGLLEAMTAGTAGESQWGSAFFGGHAYDKLIQQTPTIPDRRPTAPGAKSLAERWAKLTPDQREAAVAVEVLRGNFPQHLRRLRAVRLQATIDGQIHECIVQVWRDYLSVGSDDDFLRIPLTPVPAMKIATQLGCTLPTPKLVDAIDAAADVRLEPRPLTEARDSLATFVQHHQIIEAQFAGKRYGLMSGIKKDVVITNQLLESPAKVAIYGWRKLDGKPIQPLTTVHKSSYVDYSHGIRLVSRVVMLDGKERLIEDVLKDPKLYVLLSDEGPVSAPAAFYREEPATPAR